MGVTPLSDLYSTHDSLRSPYFLLPVPHAQSKTSCASKQIRWHLGSNCLLRYACHTQIRYLSRPCHVVEPEQIRYSRGLPH